MKSNNRSYSLNPLFIRDIIFVRKRVNMKDMSALNHKLQTMTRKELGAILNHIIVKSMMIIYRLLYI